MDAMRELRTFQVLVLEDDYYLAEDARQALEEAGATVIGPFSDAAEAITAADRQAPSCAVVDINLGGGPDFAPAKALLDRGVPILFLTGYDLDVIPPELGGVPRLQKPVDARQILRAVSVLCAG